MQAGLLLVQREVLLSDDAPELGHELPAIDEDVLVSGKGNVIRVSGISQVKPSGETTEFPVKVMADDIRQDGGAGGSLGEVMLRGIFPFLRFICLLYAAEPGDG